MYGEFKTPVRRRPDPRPDLQAGGEAAGIAGPGRRDAIIEATARTPIMGFRDDVVIRVSATADGARVDMRSASRYGLYDFGANATRVRSLLEDLDDAVGAAPAPRPEPVKKPPPPKRQQRG